MIEGNLGIYFDHTETWRQRFVRRRCEKQRDVSHSADVRHEVVWRVEIGRNAMFFHSFWLRRIEKLDSKNEGCRGLAAQGLHKIRTKLRRDTIPSQKSLKTGRPGPLFEVATYKIWITLWQENDLETKIVKAPGSRTTFGGSKCFLRGRRMDFDTLQNARQAQGLVRSAKTLSGVVDLNRVCNDALHAAGARHHFWRQFQDFVCLSWAFSW